ncbi:MAG: response regulator [Deltaproteobacteria bacterium]|nr:response regulator [Deltaproteobacteria bacterium]
MNRRVLVIEDNEQSLYLTTYILERDGFEVLSARDGLAGLELAKAERPDAVLLDIQLPGMDGYEVARTLRQIEPLANTPILAITACAMEGDRERAIEAGCDAHLEKPLNPEEFVREVARFLGVAPAKKILVIDDRDENRQQVRALFPTGGFRLMEASNGRDALALARRTPPDLVISDVLMPVMDGFTLCREWQQDPNLKPIPFVFFTGTYGDELDREHGLALGASAYLVRPQDNARLPVVVSELVGRPVTELVRHGTADERVFLREYNEALIRKIEQKMEELERLNSELSTKNAELQRSRSLMELQTRALEASANAIAITDRSLQVEWVNQAFRTLTGYSFDELKGRDLRNLLRSADEEDPTDLIALSSAVSAGRSWSGDVIRRRKDSTVFNARLTVTPVESDDEGTHHLIAVASDISERVEAEARIIEQAALLDSASEAIYVRQWNGPIRYWNRAAEKIYGCPASRAIGRGLADIVPAVGEQLIETALEALLTAGSWSGELRMQTAGVERVTLCRWTLIRDAEGHPKEILAIDGDITEHRTLESQFRRAQRLEAIGSLAGGIAHDLNNALAPILLMVEVMRMDHPEDAEVLDTVSDAAKRGAGMVRQLLNFARGTEGERVSVQLRYLLKELQGLVKSTFPKNIDVKVSYSQDLPPVKGDATQLQQVMMNLCVNARDAMPQGGHLTISASVVQRGNEPLVAIEVTDTGTGISDEVLDRIFDPFFSTKPRDKGTGLGLATVLGIARGHGGSVEVDSKLGEGSTFTVLLPVSSTPSSPPPPSEVPEPFHGDGELVLFVDDEPGIREAARRVIRGMSLRVASASDGADGLLRLMELKHEVVAVLTDLQMPRMDGITFIRELRRILPRIPVIAIAGHLDESVAEQLRELGVGGILEKPFAEADLAREIQSIMTRRRESLRTPHS